ncbi:MAG: hypothetical protein CMI54_02545 [Parcubacteria group bacterium]|jgi:hypothetical protein|nr:hypothetical protein [Parcubacteria group bacterium]|tara:strand:+ start:3591 stop:4103 length:513 start_codon:yes stop_codon:yes gene_type:complete
MKKEINFDYNLLEPQLATCSCGKQSLLSWNIFLHKYIPVEETFLIEDTGRGWSCQKTGSYTGHNPSPLTKITLPPQTEYKVINRAIEIREDRGVSDNIAITWAMNELYYKPLDDGKCPRCEKEKHSIYLFCDSCRHESDRALRMKIKSRYNHNYLADPYPSSKGMGRGIL